MLSCDKVKLNLRRSKKVLTFENCGTCSTFTAPIDTKKQKPKATRMKYFSYKILGFMLPPFCSSPQSRRGCATEGAFHSNQNPGTFKMKANGAKFSLASLRKIRKMFNFRNANHSTENSRMKIK